MTNKIELRFHGGLVHGTIAILLLIFLTSCYSDYGLSESDFDIVATYYDDGFSFGSMKTYAIPETIYRPDMENEPDTTFDNLILTKIINNLDSRGYIRIINVSPENTPDVVVFVASFSRTQEGVVVYPPYYGWYPGWGYPGYGWNYPPYWGGGVSEYNYTKGTILIQMGDTQKPDDEKELINTVWFAGINGLLEEDAASLSNRISETIDQAFEQSPYLVKN